ncbi:MAG TPA: cation:proton antiporter subunit C [Mycobacteriales bacterium]|nr:cation:proton antiporter subunit C [Mycobacteriales bacterium]
MSYYGYFVAGAVLLVGVFGMARSRNLVHAVVCLSVSQAGTYVMLLSIGYQRHATAPVFGSTQKPSADVVDPVMQALCLTDIVVSATVTALLLALSLQIAKHHGTTDPDELTALRG